VWFERDDKEFHTIPINSSFSKCCLRDACLMKSITDFIQFYIKTTFGFECLVKFIFRQTCSIDRQIVDNPFTKLAKLELQLMKFE
jgi:hypothetical protein